MANLLALGYRETWMRGGGRNHTTGVEALNGSQKSEINSNFILLMPYSITIALIIAIILARQPVLLC